MSVSMNISGDRISLQALLALGLILAPYPPAHACIAQSGQKVRDESILEQIWLPLTEEEKAHRKMRLIEQAKQGDASSCTSLGEMYAEGSEGMPQDDIEAVRWFQMAASKGSPEGQFYLGKMYLEGRGVTKDEQEAAIWFTKSAEAETSEYNYEAMNYLGDMYAAGRGVLKDDLQAAHWYEKSLKQINDEVIESRLARIYATSDDPLVKNVGKALRYALDAVDLAGDLKTEPRIFSHDGLDAGELAEEFKEEEKRSEYLDTLALAYYLNGLYDDAVVAERKAVDLKSDDPLLKRNFRRYEGAAKKQR